MTFRFVLSVLAAASLTASAWAALNLNSSKSNIYRFTYPTSLVTRVQAKAMLAELDTLGELDETKLKQWLPANFKRFGVDATRVKKIVVLPRSRDLKEVAIIVLTNPADEAQARAVTVKSSRSNTSD